MLKGPMAFMLTLPVRDILYPHIFSRLHPLEVWSLRLVCKDLYTISLQYFCTDCSRVHLDNADSPCWTAQLCAVVTILGLCHHLKELSLLATVGVGKEDQFSKSPGLYSCLTALANSTQLTKLKLVSITIDIEHKCLRALSHHCCALEELHLESLPSFSDTAMNSLLSSHSLLTLTRLSLENLPLLRDTVPSLIQSSAQLRTLSLQNTGSPQQTVPIEDALKRLRRLHTVKFSFLNCVRDRTIQVMAEYCRGLRSVMVEHCPAISKQGLRLLDSRGVSAMCTDYTEGTVQPAASFEINQT